ncbi:MAG TPA: hypothetical protein VLF68_04160 [Candidatus Saccharimonadales bacterium]|nr:hypothetical protein [Candidatus Saccharimonadales bacterium]
MIFCGPQTPPGVQTSAIETQLLADFLAIEELVFFDLIIIIKDKIAKTDKNKKTTGNFRAILQDKILYPSLSTRQRHIII